MTNDYWHFDPLLSCPKHALQNSFLGSQFNTQGSVVGIDKVAAILECLGEATPTISIRIGHIHLNFLYRAAVTLMCSSNSIHSIQRNCRIPATTTHRQLIVSFTQLLCTDCNFLRRNSLAILNTCKRRSLHMRSSDKCYFHYFLF